MLNVIRHSDIIIRINFLLRFNLVGGRTMLIDKVAGVSYVALAATTSEKPILAVVLTGLVLVFAILVLLFIILLIEGKLFVVLGRKQEQVKSETKPSNDARPQQAPIVEEGIPPQVVAAIAAAVHTMSSGSYTLRAVSTAKKGKSSWGLAGMAETTEPF